MHKKFHKSMHEHENWSIALLLGLFTFLAYGVMTSQLGMYGDDPNFLWAYHRGGAAEYQFFMKWVRDVGYLLYEKVSPLLGESILPWRIVTLCLRWLSAFQFFVIFRKAFPMMKIVVTGAACFFLLYPGFSQQSIPVEFILHFFSLNLILSSFLLVITAIDFHGWKKWTIIIIALVLTACGIFLIEYFSGLILLLPIALWNRFPQATLREKSTKIIKVSLPFWLLFCLFVLWRIFLSQSTYIRPVAQQSLAGNSLQFLVQLGIQVAHDFYMAVIKAWTLIFQFPLNGMFQWFVLGLFLLAAGLSIGFLKISDNKAEKQTSAAEWGIIAAGIAFFLAGGLPVWGAGLKMTLSLFWDRLTLSFMIGASLIVAGLIGLIIRKRFQPVVFALLIALMCTYQFQLQNQFRKEWQLAQNYFWQLKWRAPDIQPNTLIFADQLPFHSITDNSMNALLNWNYENPLHPAAENLKFFQVSARTNHIDSFLTDEAVSHNQFTGKLSDALVVYATSGTCLKVLRESDRELPFLKYDLKSVLHYANLDRIISIPTRTIQFPIFMGAEPVHRWCYYYEKAELAAQQEMWNEVLRLGKEAEALGFEPKTMTEMRPFLFAAWIENDMESASCWASKILSEKGNAQYFWRALRELDGILLSAESQTQMNAFRAEIEKEIAFE